MNAEFQWWLLILGIVIGGALVYLVLAEVQGDSESADEPLGPRPDDPAAPGPMDFWATNDEPVADVPNREPSEPGSDEGELPGGDPIGDR